VVFGTGYWLFMAQWCLVSLLAECSRRFDCRSGTELSSLGTGVVVVVVVVAAAAAAIITTNDTIFPKLNATPSPRCS
jgi:hypothetical protein